MSLYSDDNPKNTLYGTGYKDIKAAEKTIKLISKRCLQYQYNVILTMYNRAKHHKNQTPDMIEAMKIFKNWLDKYNPKEKYPLLPLNIIKKYEKLAEEYDVSRVTRGLEKSTKSDLGWLVAYKKYKLKIKYVPVFEGHPEKQDYYSLRETFLNSRLGQMMASSDNSQSIKSAKTLFFDKDGKPTKQHVILIMHGYSPFASKL